MEVGWNKIRVMMRCVHVFGRECHRSRTKHQFVDVFVSVFCTGAEKEERISFEPASQTTLCLVVARGETSRDATRR
jgi:hypothetical protein